MQHILLQDEMQHILLCYQKHHIMAAAEPERLPGWGVMKRLTCDTDVPNRPSATLLQEGLVTNHHYKYEENRTQVTTTYKTQCCEEGIRAMSGCEDA